MLLFGIIISFFKGLISSAPCQRLTAPWAESCSSCMSLRRSRKITGCCYSSLWCFRRNASALSAVWLWSCLGCLWDISSSVGWSQFAGSVYSLRKASSRGDDSRGGPASDSALCRFEFDRDEECVCANCSLWCAFCHFRRLEWSILLQREDDLWLFGSRSLCISHIEEETILKFCSRLSCRLLDYSLVPWPLPEH